MAFRSSSSWRSLLNRLGGGAATYATSTAPKMEHASCAPAFRHTTKPTLPMRAGDKLPALVAAAMISVSLSLGLYTAAQQLRHSPTVHVSKKKRETVPEVYEPEEVAKEAQEFINKSFFRKVAHIKLKDHHHDQDDFHFETLKSVGVDPKLGIS